MTDAEIASLLARARASARPRSILRELEEACRQVAASRPSDPVAKELWQALLDLSRLAGRKEYLSALRSRVESMEALLGSSHADTMRAWYDLGDAADEDLDWGTATEAWERIAAVQLPANAPLGARRVLADALRRLGARRLQASPQAARELFERELQLREALDGADHPDVITSLDNLATACEALGDIARALSLRTRELGIVEATFGPHQGNAAALRARLEALRKR